MTPRRCDAATLSERNAQLTDKATIDALTRSSAGGNVSYVGVFLRKDSHHSHHGPYEPAVVTPEVLTDPDQLYPVGSFAQVHRIQRGADPRPDRPAVRLPPGLRPDTDTDAEDDVADNVAEGQASVLLLGHRRVTLTSVDRLGPPVDVTVEHWDRIVTDPFQSDMVRALSNEIVSMIREVATLNPLFREHIHYFPTRVDSNDPMKLADFAASMVSAPPNSSLSPTHSHLRDRPRAARESCRASWRKRTPKRASTKP